MSETSKSKSNIVKLCECAIMLALSIVLSFVCIWQMPMGGEVTLLSMLPVMLISVKYGNITGLSTAFLYALFHLAKGFASGNVFVFCTTPVTVIVCIVFDYILPFSILGLAGTLNGIRAKKTQNQINTVAVTAGIVAVIFIRFICHYITGFTIWGQWANEGQSKFIYSLIYNGQYMLAECIITTAASVILIKIPHIKKLLSK